MIKNLEWFIHGHHTYYLSIKVENTAGLVNIQTSAPYIHDVQLPTKGVVLNIDTQVSCYISSSTLNYLKFWFQLKTFSLNIILVLSMVFKVSFCSPIFKQFLDLYINLIVLFRSSFSFDYLQMIDIKSHELIYWKPVLSSIIKSIPKRKVNNTRQLPCKLKQNNVMLFAVIVEMLRNNDDPMEQ